MLTSLQIHCDASLQAVFVFFEDPFEWALSRCRTPRGAMLNSA